MAGTGQYRGGFSYPPADNTPRYVDAPLGPMDRLRSWLGWTIEADMLFGQPTKTLRMDDGRLLYGDLVNGWEEVIRVDPAASGTTAHSIWDGGLSIWDGGDTLWDVS